MLRKAEEAGRGDSCESISCESIEWPVVVEAAVETDRWKRLGVNTAVVATTNKGRKKKSLLYKKCKEGDSGSARSLRPKSFRRQVFRSYILGTVSYHSLAVNVSRDRGNGVWLTPNIQSLERSTRSRDS